MIALTKITNLDEINFDRLYDESESHFSDYLKQFASKEAFRKEITDALASQYFFIQQGETPFAFKYVIDGVDRVLVGGFVNQNKEFRIVWYLTSPDANGSKADLFSEELEEIKKEFYREHDIQYSISHNTKGSSVCEFFKRRAANGDIQLEETDIDESRSILRITYY